jgi:hypothetical protein
MYLGEGGLEIQVATLRTREQAAASVIEGKVRDSQDPVLIAIDAPLGWPKSSILRPVQIVKAVQSLRSVQAVVRP